MQEFKVWFEVGVTHILSAEGIDHLLFILSLSLLYKYHEYKKLFILISGFTFGHMLSLFYCTISNFTLNTTLIEFLIPITIVISAISNLIVRNKNIYKVCLLSCIFGLLHGMAFSGSLKSLLSNTENIMLPLISFNIGVEAAQLILFCAYILLSILIIKQTKINYENLNKTVSAIIAGSGLIICYNKLSTLI